jgi:DNA polymerase III epsilon subunit-like protein
VQYHCEGASLAKEPDSREVLPKHGLRSSVSGLQSLKLITFVSMIVLDIETTGIDPRRHAIVEVGAIDFDAPGNYFNERCSVWEGAETDPEALQINGLALNEIHDKTIFTQKELISAFIAWIEKTEDKTIAGQNVDFDINFLNESSARCGLNFRLGKRKVDQHSIVFAHLLKRNIKPPLINGFSGVNSDFIMNYAGLPHEPKPHRAINGARYEAEALSRLIYGKVMFEEFGGYEIPDYLQK